MYVCFGNIHWCHLCPRHSPTLPPGKKTEQLLGWAISFDHMDNKYNLLLCLHIILLFFHFLLSNSFSLYLPLSLFPCVLKLKPSQQQATHVGNKVGRLTIEKNENTMSLLVFFSLHLVTSVCHTIHLLSCSFLHLHHYFMLSTRSPPHSDSSLLLDLCRVCQHNKLKVIAFSEKFHIVRILPRFLCMC